MRVGASYIFQNVWHPWTLFFPGLLTFRKNILGKEKEKNQKNFEPQSDLNPLPRDSVVSWCYTRYRWQLLEGSKCPRFLAMAIRLARSPCGTWTLEDHWKNWLCVYRRLRREKLSKLSKFSKKVATRQSGRRRENLFVALKVDLI